MGTSLSQDQSLIEQLNAILRDKGYVNLDNGVRLTIDEALKLPERYSLTVEQYREFTDSLRSAILRALELLNNARARVTILFASVRPPASSKL